MNYRVEYPRQFTDHQFSSKMPYIHAGPIALTTYIGLLYPLWFLPILPSWKNKFVKDVLKSTTPQLCPHANKGPT